jgi:3-oxoacyl-[acyl-carrier protein] reductase
MQPLEGRIALVTGGSKGIGAGIAAALAAAGAGVAVNYASDADGAARLVGAIGAAGGRAVAVQADVSRAADVGRMFAETRAALGPVDVLVNNAGRYAFAPLEGITEDDYRRDFDLNVLGPILTMQQFARQPEADGGAIVNITAAVVSTNPTGTGVYTATKSAVTSLSRVVAKELAPRGIRVNVIAPTATNTEGTRALGLIGEDGESGISAHIPLGRVGTPEDIGPVAVFLASDGARWITGDVIFATGGHR